MTFWRSHHPTLSRSTDASKFQPSTTISNATCQMELYIRGEISGKVSEEEEAKVGRWLDESFALLLADLHCSVKDHTTAGLRKTMLRKRKEKPSVRYSDYLDASIVLWNCCYISSHSYLFGRQTFTLLCTWKKKKHKWLAAHNYYMN